MLLSLDLLNSEAVPITPIARHEFVTIVTHLLVFFTSNDDTLVTSKPINLLSNGTLSVLKLVPIISDISITQSSGQITNIQNG
jgi:hypothetical protein